MGFAAYRSTARLHAQSADEQGSSVRETDRERDGTAVSASGGLIVSHLTNLNYLAIRKPPSKNQANNPTKPMPQIRKFRLPVEKSVISPIAGMQMPTRNIENSDSPRSAHSMRPGRAEKRVRSVGLVKNS